MSLVPKPPETLPNEQELMATWDSKFDQPLLAVICLTYNQESFIRDAIHGFLCQKTDFPFKVIIHDDASTDETAKIVREYEDKYPNIVKCIYQERNLYSRGISRHPYIEPHLDVKYIANCDGDDYWLDEYKLQKQVDYLQQNEDCSLTYHAFINFDHEQQQVLGIGKSPRTVTRVSRNLHLDLGPEEYAGKKVENVDRLLLYLYKQRGSVQFIEEVGPAVYRQHRDGIWSQRHELYRHIEALRTRLYIERQYARTRAELAEIRRDIAIRLKRLKEDCADADAATELALGESWEQLWRRYGRYFPYFSSLWQRQKRKLRSLLAPK